MGCFPSTKDVGKASGGELILGPGGEKSAEFQACEKEAADLKLGATGTTKLGDLLVESWFKPEEGKKDMGFTSISLYPGGHMAWTAGTFKLTGKLDLKGNVLLKQEFNDCVIYFKGQVDGKKIKGKYIKNMTSGDFEIAIKAKSYQSEGYTFYLAIAQNIVGLGTTTHGWGVMQGMKTEDGGELSISFADGVVGKLVAEHIGEDYIYGKLTDPLVKDYPVCLVPPLEERPAL